MKIIRNICFTVALALVAGASLLDAAHDHGNLASDLDCVYCQQHSDDLAGTVPVLDAITVTGECPTAAPADLLAQPAPIAIARGPPALPV